MEYLEDPFNACQRLHNVQFEATSEQRAMYADYKRFELSFSEDVKFLCSVHESVISGKAVAHDTVSCHFHGGALITGKPGNEVWESPSLQSIRRENEIVVEPFYPLMPESNGIEIGISAVDLPKVLHNELPKALMARFPKMKVSHFVNIFCSATSAGAFLAIRFVWRALELGFEISGLLLLYPMVQEYERSLGHRYGEYILSKTEHWSIAISMLQSMRGQHNKTYGRTPPDHMGIYPSTTVGCLTSHNGSSPKWRSIWSLMCVTWSAAKIIEGMLPEDQAPDDRPEVKESSRITINASTVATVLGDVGMRKYGIEYSSDKQILLQNTTEVLPKKTKRWPSTYIAHGKEDANCSLAGIRSFVSTLSRVFPGADLWLFEYDKQPHAFDIGYPAALHAFVQFIKEHQQDQEFSPNGLDKKGVKQKVYSAHNGQLVLQA